MQYYGKNGWGMLFVKSDEMFTHILLLAILDRESCCGFLVMKLMSLLAVYHVERKLWSSHLIKMSIWISHYGTNQNQFHFRHKQAFHDLNFSLTSKPLIHPKSRLTAPKVSNRLTVEAFYSHRCHVYSNNMVYTIVSK